MKNFYFDWNIYTGRGGFDQLLSVWNAHLVNLLILGILFSFMAISGAVWGVLKKNKVILSLLPTLSISLFLLINDNFPTGFLYAFLQKIFPIFKEALRFPDDKVLGLFVFCFAIFFAFFIENFRKFIPKIASYLGAVLLVFSLLYFMLPAFKGNLISPQVRIKIPQQYFNMFNYFNKQEDGGKIANLPIHSFWGWEYYDWYPSTSSGQARPSFQGAGLLWFGIKQPLLARDFDRWHPANEQYFREMSYAIYSQDAALLSSVIKKYDIHYLLLDKNIIAPQSNPQVLFYAETDELLNNLVDQGVLKAPQKFGKIEVFKIADRPQAESFVSLSSNIPNLYEDFSFEKYGNYIENGNQNLLLTDNSSVLNSDVFEINEQGILIKKRGLNIDLPSYLNVEKNISAEVVVQEQEGGKIAVSFYPDTFNQNNKAVPIVAEVNLQSRDIEDTILSINQKDNFPLRGLESNVFLSLGRVFLNTDIDNTVSLYSESNSSEFIADFSKIDYTLAPCTAGQNANTFGMDIDKNGDGFTIFGTNTSLCLTIPVPEIARLSPLRNITKDSLLGMAFSYDGDKNPEVCAVNLLTGACIRNVTQLTKIGERDINNLGIRVTLNALKRRTSPFTPFGTLTEKSFEQKKATYKNISFEVFKPFYSASIASDILNKSLTQASQTTNTGSELLIPFINNEEFIKNITQLSQPNNSCPGLAENVEKKIAPEHIEYISREGSLCDYFSYPNLAQNTAYAIVITSNNIKGLPLSICVSNSYSNRCDIYSFLPAAKEKERTVFILPPMSSQKHGITLDINNFAIKETETVNRLYDIAIIPFPYTWITKSITGEELKNSRIITYPYSYDSGWRAYEVKDANFLSRNFPFIFGKEIKNHVKVNGWQNGWLTSNSTIEQSNNETIVIVFLPQFLEYFGFALLVGTFGYLLFLTFNPRRE